MEVNQEASTSYDSNSLNSHLIFGFTCKVCEYVHLAFPLPFPLFLPLPPDSHWCLHFHRKMNNNIFVDDLKEEGGGRPIPKPCRTFLETFELYPEIMENIERVGFESPTPIQV